MGAGYLAVCGILVICVCHKLHHSNVLKITANTRYIICPVNEYDYTSFHGTHDVCTVYNIIIFLRVICAFRR